MRRSALCPQEIHVDLCIKGGVPAVPEQGNDGLVPPLKILRKRLNGVYRADGFSGPTRRYVLIVALLVGLASLPTLAAITAGTDELDGGTTGAMDVPFLPPASSGPVVPVRPSPSPPVSPPVVPSRPHGIAGEQKTRPPRYAPSSPSHDSRGAETTSPSSGSSSGTPAPDEDAPVLPGFPGKSVPPNKPTDPSRPADPFRPAKPAHPADPSGPARPPSRPAEPDDRPPGFPLCHERGKCGSRESRHHRPDWSRHRHCEESTHRAHWSHHREGRTRSVVVHIVPSGRHGHHATIRERNRDHDRKLRQATGRHVAGHQEQSHNPFHQHRSADRSEHSRRSTMTERPQNIRPARTGERTQNSRRTSESHWDEPQSSSRSYHGSHRAPSMHRVDDRQSAARDRSSRVGRHHAGHDEEHSNRR
jgi:hypothetical protein